MGWRRILKICMASSFQSFLQMTSSSCVLRKQNLEIIAGSLGSIHKQENTEFNQLKYTQRKDLNLCQKLNEYFKLKCVRYECGRLFIKIITIFLPKCRSVCSVTLLFLSNKRQSLCLSRPTMNPDLIMWLPLANGTLANIKVGDP